MLDAVQFQGHHQVRVDRTRDALITDFGRATLDDRYLLPGESYQDLFARVSSFYGDDAGHAQRLYDYMSKMWFMPATPVLSNGGTTRGLPISCFLNEATDSLDGIVGLWNENVWLASKGGGIGSSLQADLLLGVNPQDHQLLQSLGADLKFVFITSSATLAAADELTVTVTPASAQKCERCWHYSADVGSIAAHPTICGRCDSNLHGSGEIRQVA